MNRVNRKTVQGAVKQALGQEYIQLSDTGGLTKRDWVEAHWAVHPCNAGSKNNRNDAFDEARYNQLAAKLEEDYQKRNAAFQKAFQELNASDLEQPEDNLPEATFQEKINNSPSVSSDEPKNFGSARKNFRGNPTIESDEDSEVPEVTPAVTPEVTPKITFGGTHIYFSKGEESDNEERSDEERFEKERSDEEPSDEEPDNEEPDNEESDNEESEKSFTSAETHDGDSGDDSDEPDCEKDTHDGDSADELSTLREKLANMTKAFADNAKELLDASQERDFQREKDMIIRMYFEIENYKREKFLEAINSAELGDYSILNAVQEEHAEIFN